MTTKIAVLLTCHNRKDKTTSCLKHLFEAYETVQNNIKISVYLTDDGSSDGTSETVKEMYPEVIAFKGNGNLFWAGGMRSSWKEAIKFEYDGYLLLNDDTNVTEYLFREIFKAHEFSISKYGFGGIYIGSTKDIKTNESTYGGAIFTNRFLFKYELLTPQKNIQNCDLGNANIMFVSKDAYKKIGMLSNKYIHGVADYDYTLTAKKHNVPVLITPNYCGFCCKNDKNINKHLFEFKLKERIKYLYDPTGLAFNDNLIFMKSFFPYRLPFVFIAAWFKVLFPKIYISINNFR